jgi:glycine/D-amino acid oxidase-like deaminating enzyme
MWLAWRTAERAGVSLWPETPVQQVTENAGGYRERTSRGALVAGNVVAATSGYTGAATPRLRRRILPIGSNIIATEALPEGLAREVNPRNRIIFDSKNFLYYFRLTPDRRMQFGGRAGFSTWNPLPWSGWPWLACPRRLLPKRWPVPALGCPGA